MESEFSWMPKDDKVVAAPLIRSSASGTPSSQLFARVVARAFLHSQELGVPNSRNSSMLWILGRIPLYRSIHSRVEVITQKMAGAEARPKGNLTVDIYLITPLYTIEGTIFGVDGNNAICIANINFCQLSIVPKSTL